MKQPDAGSVGIYGSAIGGVSTTSMTAADWITINATAIGLSLTVVSLIIGIWFKWRDSVNNERQHKELLELRIAEEEKTREALIKEIQKNALPKQG